MATDLYGRNQFCDIDDAYAPNAYVLGTATGISTVAAVVNVSGAAAPWTLTAGGSEFEFISAPLAADITISGTITYSVYAFESNMSANVGMRVIVQRIRRSGGAWSADSIHSGNVDDGVELNTTVAQMTWTSSPNQNTSFLRGDRIRIVFWIAPVGTAGSGFTATLRFGNTVANTAECKITFTENLTFIEDQRPTAIRYREDDGSETTATTLAAGNITRNIVTSPNIRVRVATWMITGSGSTNIYLWYKKNGGTWTQVKQNSAGEANVRLTTSANFASGDNTTQQLSSGTFNAGEMHEDGAGTDYVARSTGLAFSNKTEYEFMVRFQASDLSNGDTIDFVVGNSTDPFFVNELSSLVTIQGPINVSLSQNVDVNDVANSNQVFSSVPVSQAVDVNDVYAAGLRFTDTMTQAVTMGFTSSAGLLISDAITQAITTGYTTSSIHRILDAVSQNADVNDVYAAIHRSLMSVSQSVDVNDVYAAQHRILDAVSQAVDVNDVFAGGLNLPASVSQSITTAAVHAAVMRFSQSVPADVNVEDTYAGVVRIAAALAQAIALADTYASALQSNNYQVDVSFAITPAMLAAAAHVVRETIIATADVNDAYSVLQRLAGAVSQNMVADVAHDGVMRAQAAAAQAITVASLFNGGSSLFASVSNAVAVNVALVAGMRFSMTMTEALAMGDPFAANWRTTAEMAQALAVGYAVTSRLAALAGVNETVNVEDLEIGGIRVQASLTEALLPVVTYATTAALQAGFQASVNVDVFDDFRAAHSMGATVSFPIVLTDRESDIGIEFRQMITLGVTIVDQVISINLQVEAPGWSDSEPQANTWTDPTA